LKLPLANIPIGRIFFLIVFVADMELNSNFDNN
jgi:hypothetical protein